MSFINTLYRIFFGLAFLYGCTSLKHDDDGISSDEAASINSDSPDSPSWGSAGQPSHPFNDGGSSDEPEATTTIPESGTAPETDAIPEADSEDADRSDGCTEQQFYLDHDTDGFGNPATIVEACEPPVGFVTKSGDCDDDCITCFPGAPELCGNNKDDSCDGSTDESCPCAQGEEKPCGEDEGECQPGIQRCVNGEWSDECEGAKTKSDEICDGLDNDCDGQTDEDISGTGASCDGSDTDLCKEGTMQCNGTAIVCSDTTDNTTESCNGQDDDCDGSIDEAPSLWGSLCPTGEKCEDGDCVVDAECGNGIKEGDEECDDGNINTFDMCNNSCQLALYSYCTSDSQCPNGMECQTGARYCTIRNCTSVSQCSVNIPGAEFMCFLNECDVICRYTADGSSQISDCPNSNGFSRRSCGWVNGTTIGACIRTP